MRTRITSLLLPVCLLSFVGCGDGPEVQTYVTEDPAPYVWPVTEQRPVSYDDGVMVWEWDVPAGWVDAPEVPDQLVADYRFPGTTQDLPGRMTVAMLSGDGGGVSANVARWQQQLFATNVSQLGPDDVVSEPMAVPVGRAVLVELKGQYRGIHAPTYLSGAIVSIPAIDGSIAQTWTFKLVGDQATVLSNRMQMLRLILSFRPEGADAQRLPDELLNPDPTGTDAGEQDAPSP